MKRSASDRNCSKRVSERTGPGTALRITTVRRLTVRTDRRTQLVDITRLVEEALDGADGAGAALVYVPHTTAGVTINEAADPAVARDLEAALEQIVGDEWRWQHVEDPDGPNAPSHVRASLVGPQVLVPL